MIDRLESRFKEKAKIYLKKDPEKHANYLENVVLKGLDTVYQVDDFERSLEIFKGEPDKGVDLIYDCLEEALKEKHTKEMEKGERILEAYNSDELEIQKTDHDSVSVESESTKGKTYTVELKDFSCECQSAKTLSYAGLWCKHACAAYQLYGDSFTGSQKDKTEIEEAQAVLISELETVKKDGNSFITYGNQKLKIRKERANSYIPDEVTFFLEGKNPEMIMYALENDLPLLLIGESGTGKSKMIQALAHATNTPLMAPCGHAEVTIEHLLGCFIAKDGSTVWKNGVIPTAMRRGYWLMIEEVNAIDPSVLKALNELLDTRKITLTIAGKPKVISANEKFRIICSSNPPDNPIYRGIEPMSFEFFDRFPVVVKMDYLSPSAERSAVEKLTGFSDSDTLEKMVEFANRVREGMKNSELFATVTTRSLVQWAEMIRKFGLRASAEIAVLNKFDPQSYTKAVDLLDAYFD